VAFDYNYSDDCSLYCPPLLFINVGQRSGLYWPGWLYCLTLSTINYCFELDRGGVCVDVVGYVVHHYCLIIGRVVAPVFVFDYIVHHYSF